MIALSCGIKMPAVHHLDLSQSTRVTDRRTDRITIPKTALAVSSAFYSALRRHLSSALRFPVRDEQICFSAGLKVSKLGVRSRMQSGGEFQAIEPATENARRPNLL